MKILDATSSHIPVLLNEVLKSAEEIHVPLKTALDGTFGRGGHARAFLEKFSELRVTALDRDQTAIDFGRSELAHFIRERRLDLVHKSFLEYASTLENKTFDFILLDLGVSSPQLDIAERGFSFYDDGPLDMRMDQSHGFTAADFLNEADEEELIRIFQDLGEVRRPYRVVRAIIHDRKTQPYTTTKQLADMIARVDGWRQKGRHPATLYFMGLRIHVNGELDQVRESIPRFVEHLNPGGRISVITFHSIEDRVVKQVFKSLLHLGHPVNKKVIVPSREEEMSNPRARSAKLRIFERATDDFNEFADT